MNVMQTYSKRTAKLCHRKPGDVVQLQFNDGRFDCNLYMVLSMSTVEGFNLANLANGMLEKVHASTRCVHFPNASLDLGEE